MSESTDITTEATADSSTEAEQVEATSEATTQDTRVDAATQASDESIDDGDAEEGGVDEGDEGDDHERLEHEGDVAADYLEELLDIADLDGDLDIDVEGDRAVVSVVGADLSQLVGQRGEVLDALQELTRLAVYRETGERSRLMLDISGHRADLRRQLVELANAAVERVQASGEQESLRAMSPFERKVVHDAVAAAGLTSESEGVEPRRYVVILPA